MKRFLLFGMVLLGLVSCQEEPLEELLQEDPDIMIYWSNEYVAYTSSQANVFITALIGELPANGERFYLAWKEDKSCEVVDTYEYFLSVNDSITIDSPYSYFTGVGGSQVTEPDYIMFSNSPGNVESNDFLECTFPWGATPWNTVKHPVEWYAENGFTVYEIN